MKYLKSIEMEWRSSYLVFLKQPKRNQFVEESSCQGFFKQLSAQLETLLENIHISFYLTWFGLSEANFIILLVKLISQSKHTGFFSVVWKLLGTRTLQQTGFFSVVWELLGTRTLQHTGFFLVAWKILGTGTLQHTGFFLVV